MTAEEQPASERTKKLAERQARRQAWEQARMTLIRPYETALRRELKTRLYPLKSADGVRIPVGDEGKLVEFSYLHEHKSDIDALIDHCADAAVLQRKAELGFPNIRREAKKFLPNLLKGLVNHMGSWDERVVVMPDFHGNREHEQQYFRQCRQQQDLYAQAAHHLTTIIENAIAVAAQQVPLPPSQNAARG